MIPHEKLKAVRTIISHAHCSDGLASAILLKDAYTQRGLSPEVRFMQHGTEEYRTLKPSADLLFCDFFPYVPEIEVDRRKVHDPEKLRAWAESGAIVLDHHKGSQAIVAAFRENGVFADEMKEPGVSGAFLAFREVWLPFYRQPLPLEFRDNDEILFARDFAVIAGIRDTWQNHHPLWRKSCIQNEILRFYPSADWLDKPLPFHPGNHGFWKERLELGDLLWTKHEKGIKRCIEKAWRFTSTKGTRVLVFDGCRSVSDVAEEVDQDFDLVMAFDYEVEYPKETPNVGGVRKIIYSIRSHTTFDCLAFAKTFPGGGGHTKSSGFNINLELGSDAGSRYARHYDPYSLAEALVNKYEG
jgi:hypothetical protein